MGVETWARQVGDESTPGPGNYNNNRVPGPRSPSFTIKSRYRDHVDEEGPKYVSLPSLIGQSPKYTIRPQTKPPEPFSTPGPSYVPPRFGDNYLRRTNGTMRTRSNSFTGNRRMYISYDHDPNGPAAADTRSRPSDKRSPAFKIGEHDGSSWLRINQNPGSADYRPRMGAVIKSAPMFSIRESHDAEDDTVSPGPGDYDTKDEFGKRPLAVRPRHKELPKFETPGPGEYEQKCFVGQDSPKTAIRPLCPKKEDRNGVPYRRLHREFDSVKGMTIGSKTVPLSPFKTPGPSDYSPRRSWNSGQGHTLSPRSGKQSLHGSWLPGWRSPGPAEYDSNDQAIISKAPAYTLSDNLGPRFFSPSNTPGPDAYSPDKSMVSTRSPRYSIRPKCGNRDVPSLTQQAGFVSLENNIPYAGPKVHIRPKENLPLIPK